jgi:hypothetical protein
MQSGCNPLQIGPIFTFLLILFISLSVLGLFAGAGLVALGRLRLSATSALEGLALGMLPALVLLRLLPHAYESLGPLALALAAVGFGAVSLSHHAGERAEARLGGALVLPALLLHAVTDGAALAMSNTGRVGDSAGFLALAAILHRIPEGFFIASRQRARGARAALLAAAPLAIATIAGAVLGQRIFDVLPDSALDAVLAVGAGAMLRLFVHSHDEAPSPPPPAARAIAAAALLIGVIIVVAVPGPDDVLQSAQPREFSVAHSLLPLFIESSPALLLGLCLSSLLRARTQRLNLRVAGQALRGLAWGFALQTRPPELPGQLPRLRNIRATPAWIAGLCVAASQLGVETIALSVAWLGPELAALRVLGGLAIALAIGLGCGRALSGQNHHDDHDTVTEPRSPLSFWAVLQRGLDDNAAFIVLGLLLSAALEAGLKPELLLRLPDAWESALACLVAILARLGALAVMPVVAVLLHKGLSLGAGLTLLWLSPLAGIPLALWFGRRPTVTSALIASAATGALCVALGQVGERVLTKYDVPELHPLVMHACSPWEYACAALLALLLVRSLLRLGPRGFASTRPPPSSDRTLCALPH